MNAETAVEITKWTSLRNHIIKNKIEYLVLFLIGHTLGLTSKVLEQTNGVCL